MEDKEKASFTSFVLSEKSIILLLKLARIHESSQAGIIEHLINKEAKEYGLIETRE